MIIDMVRQIDDFNPRSREGSDKLCPSDALSAIISIHAPAKGATGRIRGDPLFPSISIHAPAKGATRCQSGCNFPSENFNPRSREGSDFSDKKTPLLSKAISIHAPAKGATFKYFAVFFSVKFQSTLPRRERQNILRITSIILLFQSTLPRRERPKTMTLKKKTCRFQSTLPRRERRFVATVLCAAREISIHAPAKGATCYQAGRPCDPMISIHAPAKGATRTGILSGSGIGFQSTLPRRERLLLPLSHHL